jgi:hypothetical protein
VNGEDSISRLHILVDIARTMKWKSAVYVGDSAPDTTLVTQLLTCNRSFDLLDFLLVDNEVDPVSLYARIEYNTVDFVLVHCHSTLCYRVIRKLLYLRNEELLHDSPVPWLMTEFLTQNIISTGLVRVPRTTYGLQEALPNSPLSDVLLDDVWSLERFCHVLGRCPVTLQQQLEVVALYDSLTVVLNLLEDNRQRRFMDSEELARFITEANLKGVARAIRFYPSSSERYHPTLYNVVDLSPSSVTTIGVYDNSRAVWLHKLRPLSRQEAEKRGRFKRAAKVCPPPSGPYRVTTMREPPFVIFDPNKTYNGPYNGFYTGIVVEMMDWLAKEIGFQYTLSEPEDAKYGSIGKDGNGNGMVGQLMSCKTDIAAAAFVITSERSEHIQFTKPYMEVGKTLLVYKGETKSTGLWAFLSPFDVVTRIVVVASLVGVSIVFAILGKVNSYRGGLKCPNNDQTGWPDNSFWFLYTSFMQQGPESIPSIAGKVLVAGWFFFCLVIVATYTANLAAFLTVRSFEDSIDSLDDLAAQTNVVYGTVKNTSITEFFRSSPLDVHQRIYWYMTNTPDAMVDTVEEAYDRVQHKTKGEYIFIWDQPILDYVSSQEPCKSQVVGRAFAPQGYAFATSKGNLELERNLTLGILQMRETFHIDQFLKKWLTSGPCPSTTTVEQMTDAEEVRIGDMIGVFVILGSTVGASLLIALIELLWWRLWKRPVAVGDYVTCRVPSQDQGVQVERNKDLDSLEESPV